MSNIWRAILSFAVLILGLFVILSHTNPSRNVRPTNHILEHVTRQLDSDGIQSIVAPSTVSAGQTVEVTVTYTLAGSRDILVDLVHRDDGTWYGGSRVTSTASGTSSISVTLASSIPSSSTYTFSVHLVPVGDSWEQSTVNVLSADVSVQSASASSTLSSTSSIQNGVNLLPQYYNNGNPDLGWSLMTTFGNIKTVRFLVDPSMVSQAASWLAQAQSHGYSVILAYNVYSEQGSDEQSVLETAARWWVSNYATLTQNGAYSFTINIMNEWGNHFISASDFAAAYNSAISIVRQVYSGPIILQAPGYGQVPQVTAEAITGTGTTITDKNIIIAMHLFPYSWNGYTHSWLTAADLEYVANIGVPIIVGEFGFIESLPSGADITSLMSYAVSQGWPRLGWVWNGDGMGSDMIQPDWVNQPTATSYSVNSYFSEVYNNL